MSGKDIIAGVASGIAAGVEKAREISDGPGAVPVHAAIRQGASELGQALKAFPDAVQGPAEPGGVLTTNPNPLKDAKEAVEQAGPEIDMD